MRSGILLTCLALQVKHPALEREWIPVPFLDAALGFLGAGLTIGSWRRMEDMEENWGVRGMAMVRELLPDERSRAYRALDLLADTIGISICLLASRASG